MSDIALVLVYHKGDLTYKESKYLLSIRNNPNINSLRKIIVLPKDVIIQESLNDILKELNFSIERVPNYWLKNYQAYNITLTRRDFYAMFKDYRYILIYQTDVYTVPSDRSLDNFIQNNYDYVGGIIYKVEDNYSHTPIKLGGNGGVCLKNIQKHIEATKKFQMWNLHDYYYKIGYKSKLNDQTLKFLFKKYLSRIIPLIYYRKIHFSHFQEDSIWSLFLSKTIKDFKASENEVSASFAFDMFPKKSFKLIEQQPLFYHAPEKNNDGFYDELEILKS